jgi:hypothetical protein
VSRLSKQCGTIKQPYRPPRPVKGDSFALLCFALLCECGGAVGGMRIGRGIRTTLRKLAPVPLRRSQIPYEQNRGSNLGRRGGKPATNRLGYGTSKDDSN